MTVLGWLVAFGALVLAGVLGRSVLGSREALAEARSRVGELDERLAAKRAVEDRLSRALDEIRLGVVLVGPDGDVTFRNLAAAALADPRHGDAIVAGAVEELLSAALGGAGGEREIEEFGPPLRSHVIRCFPLWGGATGRDGVVGALALIEQNTERRRLDQIRRDFVANISHELRTPVGALGLLAETIIEEPNPETVRRLAARMVVESERVADTIEDLLELSRIEFADDTQVSELDLCELVDEAASRMAAAAELRDVELRRGAPSPVRVMGDPRQLVSALYNLMDNAVKFSPSGGRVEIEVVEAEDEVRVAVRDSGPGIPSRDLDRIFERFYRVDRARSRQTGGTGLGLAIVRHVAANHGGDITVSSREGSGSTFELCLPVSAGEPTHEAGAQRGEAR